MTIHENRLDCLDQSLYLRSTLVLQSDNTGQRALRTKWNTGKASQPWKFCKVEFLHDYERNQSIPSVKNCPNPANTGAFLRNNIFRIGNGLNGWMLFPSADISSNLTKIAGQQSDKISVGVQGNSGTLHGYIERLESKQKRLSVNKETGEAQLSMEVTWIGQKETESTSDETIGWRSTRSSLRTGKPFTWRRGAGSIVLDNGNVHNLRGFLMNTEEIQWKLWEQSKTQKGITETIGTLFEENPYQYRIRNLYDLMHNPHWLRIACNSVMKRSKGKASGVDSITVSQFKENLERNLELLRLELKNGTYQPKPVRQVMIPKANGKMRALGIPCLRDKIVQEAMRMALEPIFEVEFHDNSYGFRPNRNTHHAVTRCRILMQAGFKWVIEGDVKACFDEISHKAIIQALREKIMDKKFLSLTKKFLKAGVVKDGVVHATRKGVPQGGVLSPLLSNVVLNKLDWFLHNKGKYDKARTRACQYGWENVRFARYADDWCVFITRGNKKYAEQLKEEIRQFLDENCSLELSVEKTHVTHVRDGFDFLGFHLVQGIGKRGKLVPKIKVSQKAKTRARRRIDEALRYRPHQESITVRINRGSAVVRGWANYFCIAHDYSKTASALDHYSYWSATKAICRKYNISTAKCLKKYSFGNYIGVDKGCKLIKFSETKMSLDYHRPIDYISGNVFYETDDGLEVNFGFLEERSGAADLKRQTLERDGSRCRQCEKSVNSKTSQADHIIPVKRFANVKQSQTLDNIQTLCLECHKKKTKYEMETKHEKKV